MQADANPKPTYSTTHAVMDPAHCRAKGLVCCTQKGKERKKLRAWIGKGQSADDGFAGLEFVGPDTLSPADIKVLYVLIALSNKEGKELPLDPKTEHGLQLRALADEKVEPAYKSEPSLSIKTSYRQIAKEVGIDPDSGTSIATVRDSVERMSNVVIWRQMPQPPQGGQKRAPVREQMGTLLCRTRIADPDTPIFVAIDRQLTKTILEKLPYTRIGLDEVRRLSDPGVAIHMRLCSHLGHGDSWKFAVDTLAFYAWPDATANANTLKKRKAIVRKVLSELAGDRKSVV